MSTTSVRARESFTPRIGRKVTSGPIRTLPRFSGRTGGKRDIVTFNQWDKESHASACVGGWILPVGLPDEGVKPWWGRALIRRLLNRKTCRHCGDVIFRNLGESVRCGYDTSTKNGADALQGPVRWPSSNPLSSPCGPASSASYLWAWPARRCCGRGLPGGAFCGLRKQGLRKRSRAPRSFSPPPRPRPRPILPGGGRARRPATAGWRAGDFLVVSLGLAVSWLVAPRCSPGRPERV